MKQLLILLVTTFLISTSYSQDSVMALPRVVEDTLFTTSGYKIIVGEDITIGTGTTDDGDFKFIRKNSTGFGTMMQTSNNNRYNKSELSLKRNMAGHKGKVVKIVTRGNKKIGKTYEPLITFGSGRYEIDVENAIASGEIVVPEEFRPKPKVITTVVEVKQSVSVADELVKFKKLLDDGIITKDEYEAQKKKLLEGN
ncbi:MAG: SHOCT domain-containing protein [Bacteroidota bacterium]